ncbi:MAG: elongation factor G [Saprospirales bacterium]|nr:elongation factor G [Saprospirales bacterium]
MGYDTKNIRNVVLLGHSGCGKTTFTETMLFEAGAISRRGTVEEGNTISDFNALEQERSNSIFSTLMHVSWKDSKINIIDTPGLDDFVGEVVSSMKVSDTSVMLLNAKNGVEVGTELIWDYIEQFKTPAMFVINQVDHEKADFEATLEQAINRFGPKVLAFQYPLNPGTGFNSIIDALRMVMYVFPPDGGKPEKKEIPASERDRALAMHNALVEAAAEENEGLMERFFEEGTLSEEDLADGLRIGIGKQDIFPVFCCSATRNMGSGRIMGFINDICPSPTDRPPKKLENGTTLPCVTQGPTTIFIYKTIYTARVGNVSYFKVYSGVLKSGDELVNAANDGTERFSSLFLANGKNRDQVDELRAGDLGVTVKLKNSHTNQTLNTKGTDRQIARIKFPEPRLHVAVEPPSKNDMEKLMRALHLIEEEDPTLVVEQSATLKQTLLHAQGQLHLDIIKYRIEQVYGVSMDFVKPRIPYRETITKEANEMYRHKKQTGGAGQFAEVHMRIEPYFEGMADPTALSVKKTEVDQLPWGGKLVFLWCIVGGSIDAKFSNAIKKGILQKMEEGPLTGSNCQDIRVSIYDGKMHPVDSNDMAFMLAATQAFKAAFQKSQPQILEPIYELDILCSDEAMGDIMGDLQTRRAIIMGMDSEGHYQKIIAKVPLAELYQYSSILRSLSQGRAKFTQTFLEYASVPGDIQARLIEAHKDEDEEE